MSASRKPPFRAEHLGSLKRTDKLLATRRDVQEYKASQDSLASINVNTYYLEYYTSRSGGFEPLKYLPKDKFVVLGVVTSKFAELENKTDMVDRIYRVADHVAQGAEQSREQTFERMDVSPLYGLASHCEGNLLSYDDMVEKLKLVRAVADEIWLGQP